MPPPMETLVREIRNFDGQVKFTPPPPPIVTVGRQECIMSIVEELRPKNEYFLPPSEIGKIVIVGMPGVGKTTVAHLVYTHYRVRRYFDFHIWVHVSSDFNYTNLIHAMLHQIPHHDLDYDDHDDEALLVKCLGGKTFLLVLDGLTPAHHDWDIFHTPRKFGANDSKIIITTRYQSLASLIPGTSLPYPLEPLPKDDSWQLFSARAFQTDRYSSNPEFAALGREIVNRKCGGLPFIINTLADYLSSKPHLSSWYAVLATPVVASAPPQSAILSSLEQAYQQLSSYSMCCFTFCSLFPKGFEFQKEDISLLWLSAGLLPPPLVGQRLEDVGRAIFDELVSAHFLLQLNKDKSTFVMHDLIFEFAQYLFKQTCPLMKQDAIRSISEKLSHVCSVCVNPFRTLLSFTGQKFQLPEELLNDIFTEMLDLWVLRLSHSDILRLPDSIGQLLHLTYLDLSRSSIQKLPASICRLSNLKTFLLLHCLGLTRLPSEFVELLELSYFDNDGTPLKQMPAGMSRLINLCMLTNFIVSKTGGSSIKELASLLNLQTLCISELQNIVVGDASSAKLEKKSSLDELVLQWSNGECNNSSEHAATVLENLRPPTNLKNLSIKNYGGTDFPNWLISFPNIVFLWLSNCKHCSQLPPLGEMPSLKDLIIEGLDRVTKIGPEFYGRTISSSARPFPSLENLTFETMLGWEEWTYPEIARGEFRSLKILSIRKCPNLKGYIPKNLPEHVVVETMECPMLKDRMVLVHRDLNVSRMSQLRNLPPGLRRLKIMDCNDLVNLPENIFSSNPDLHSLEIYCCYYLKSFPKGCSRNRLTSLHILSCKELNFNPSVGIVLERLYLHSSCDSLESIPLALFPKLKILSVSDCANLRSVTVSDRNVLLLEILTIKGCPKLESILEGGLCASNVTQIVLSECKNLEQLPEMLHMFISLDKLSLRECPKLASFPQGGLPPNLVSLEIFCCERLTPDMNWKLTRLRRLSKFVIIGGCSGMVSFPEENLLPSNLNNLHISKLPNLKNLNSKALCEIMCLEEMEIRECNELESFPEDGLPFTLSSVRIYDCPILKETLRYKTGNIHRIRHVFIDGGELR